MPSKIMNSFRLWLIYKCKVVTLLMVNGQKNNLPALDYAVLKYVGSNTLHFQSVIDKLQSERVHDFRGQPTRLLIASYDLIYSQYRFGFEKIDTNGKLYVWRGGDDRDCYVDGILEEDCQPDKMRDFRGISARDALFYQPTIRDIFGILSRPIPPKNGVFAL